MSPRIVAAAVVALSTSCVERPSSLQATLVPASDGPPSPLVLGPDVVPPSLDVPVASPDVPAAPPPDPPDPLAGLSRPERQWHFINQASDGGCRDRLTDAGAKFITLPDETAPNRHGCAIPHGVVLQRGVSGVRYSPPLRVDCSFALRLGEVETILTEEAQTRFGSKPARIGHIGSYVCREVIGRLSGWSGGISEHSFGNAVDITHVDLENGRRISVLQHYRSELPAFQPQRGLLHTVLERVWDEADMRCLGPDFDASHRDHFHVDAGSRWWRR